MHRKTPTSPAHARFRPWARAALACTLAASAWAAQAAPTQLVVNGEFEAPVIGTNTWACVNSPGWTSSFGCLEIWGATYLGGSAVAALGSDGLAHGQHHELTYASNTEFTTQAAAIAANGSVDFSFDGWRRDATGIVWSLTGSISGLLASGTLQLADDDWHAATAAGLAVSAGETLTMRFQSTGLRANPSCGGSAGCGAHIGPGVAALHGA